MNLVASLVNQLRGTIAAAFAGSVSESIDDSNNGSKSGRAALAHLLQASRLVSEEQLCEAEKRSRVSGLSLTDCLISTGWISKDLVEAAQTMQIQIETGELETTEARAVLLGQKQLHDAHVCASFFQSRPDILRPLPYEIESFIDEIFGQIQPEIGAPSMVAYASRN